MSRPKPPCLARQHGDQMLCGACGLEWDVNDPEPPTCKGADRRTRKVKAIIDEERAASVGLPATLSREVLAEMEQTYRANIRGASLQGRMAGMQAAYRLLLDRQAP